MLLFAPMPKVRYGGCIESSSHLTLPLSSAELFSGAIGGIPGQYSRNGGRDNRWAVELWDHSTM